MLPANEHLSGLTVGISRPYNYPDLHRQTPGDSGMWGDVRFQIDAVTHPCDVLVVLNRVAEELTVECREAWLVIQEPPVDVNPWVRDGHDPFQRVYSPFCSRHGRYYPSQGALPWHLEMTYDQLKALPPPQKNRTLSWVTSSLSVIPGHVARMKFLNCLRQSGVPFDLFGRGWAPIADKYEGLAPYRYSLAIENYPATDHWTEKIADCFLSWTMPIYYGCANLEDYFPRESFIRIDIDDPNVCRMIGEVAASDRQMKAREAIHEARRLVLDRYQLFPFIAGEAEQDIDRLRSVRMRPRRFLPYRQSVASRIKKTFRLSHAS